MTASVFSASTAAGYAGFLSPFMTRGIALPEAPIALRRKRLAAAVSRFAVSKKSMVWPVESSARYKYLSSPWTLMLGLINPIAPVGRLEMRTATFVQFGRISLHPAPYATGIHLDPPFGHQFRDVLVRARIPEIPAHTHRSLPPGTGVLLNGFR